MTTDILVNNATISFTTKKTLHKKLSTCISFVGQKILKAVYMQKQKYNKWATSWQNQQNDLCAQQGLRSAWASTQSDQSLHFP